MKLINYIIIGGIFVLFAGSSCATQKKCFEKWAMAPDTIRTVSVRDSIVYNDTTIYYTIPGEIVRDSILITKILPGKLKPLVIDTVYAKTTFANAKAWVSNSRINIKLIQDASVLRIQLDSALVDSYHWRMEYINITQVLREKYVPKIYKQALSICLFIFACVFIFIGWKVYKTFFK